MDIYTTPTRELRNAGKEDGLVKRMIGKAIGAVGSNSLMSFAAGAAIGAMTLLGYSGHQLRESADVLELTQEQGEQIEFLANLTREKYEELASLGYNLNSGKTNYNAEEKR